MSELRWIRLSFTDVFGTSNSLQIPATAWDRVVEHGVVFDGSALEGRARVFETDMLLRPVPTTLVDLGGGLGRAVCEVLTTARTAWAGDPRTALRLITDRTGDVGALWRGTAELEFFVVGPDGGPVDGGYYFDDAQGPAIDSVFAACELVAAHGVPIASAHHEAGPGQYEIDLGPLPPVELADALVLTKQAVRHTAKAAGLDVTFMARPFGDVAGSGLHVHQTIEGLLDGSSLTDDGRAFVGGQLAHARGMCAIFAPSVNSYKRLHATAEAPSAVMWSHRHRASLIRVNATGIEFRGGDPMANPYLFIAALLLTGVDGLQEGIDPGLPEDESTGGYEVRLAESLYRPLPRSLDEALDLLAEDDVLNDGFDSQLVARLIDGRRREADEARRHVTEWERARYLFGA